MANPEWVKGKSGNPKGKPKGIKNRETLLKEERRAIFDKKVQEKWEQIIDQLPPQYVADQFMGKAEDKLKVDAVVETNLDNEALDEAAKAYGTAAIKRKTG